MTRDSLFTPTRLLTRHFFVRAVVALICLASLLALCGWAFAIPELRSLIPGAVQMKVNTALAFLLSGSALYVLVNEATGRVKPTAALLSCAIAAIGAASLTEYLFDWRLGIDELFIKDNAVAYNAAPGRMS